LLSKKKKLKRIIALILSCILTISGINYQEKIEAETSKRARHRDPGHRTSLPVRAPIW